MTPEEGLFIVFEGLDGAGLSTQAARLAAFLTRRGREVLLTKEPTASPIGQLIKLALNRHLAFSPFTLQLLFAADRAEHLAKEIEPAVQARKIVISDRYILSSLAFGAVETELATLQQLNARFRKPDLTIILDTPPRVCLARIRENRETIELFEEETRLERVRAQYLALRGHFANTVIIPGDQSIEAVSKEVQAVVEQTLFRA
jgi:dTMP kinase